MLMKLKRVKYEWNHSHECYMAKYCHVQHLKL